MRVFKEGKKYLVINKFTGDFIGEYIYIKSRTPRAINYCDEFQLDHDWSSRSEVLYDGDFYSKDSTEYFIVSGTGGVEIVYPDEEDTIDLEDLVKFTKPGVDSTLKIFFSAYYLPIKTYLLRLVYNVEHNKDSLESIITFMKHIEPILSDLYRDYDVRKVLKDFRDSYPDFDLDFRKIYDPKYVSILKNKYFESSTVIRVSGCSTILIRSVSRNPKYSMVYWCNGSCTRRKFSSKILIDENGDEYFLVYKHDRYLFAPSHNPNGLRVYPDKYFK